MNERPDLVVVQDLQAHIVEELAQRQHVAGISEGYDGIVVEFIAEELAKLQSCGSFLLSFTDAIDQG